MIATPPAPPPPPPAHALVTLRPGASPTSLGSGAGRLDRDLRVWLVPLTGGLTVDGLAARPGVEAVEPDRVRAPEGGPDPLLVRQGHLRQIRWTPPRGSRRPLVAVLDTGVDASIPELRGRLAPGARSFVDDDPFSDREGHGTHVAGLIAARSRNGIGGAGVADARLLIVKIADASGRATTATMVRGIRYAVSRRARIINISFGGSGYSPLEQRAILDARRAGALVIAAAGNSGRAGNPREYPGGYRHVLTVGAVRSDGRPLLISTRGPQVALAAPGKQILSTAPRGRFALRTGTSMATALVSGAAARLLAQRPGLQAQQLRSLLVGAASGGTPPARDDALGWGVLDLAAALAAPTPGLDRPEPDDDPALARLQPALLAGAGPGEVSVRGTLEDWADPKDAVRVGLRAGEALEVEAQGPAGADLDLFVWRPGAPAFTPGPAYVGRWLAGAAIGPGPSERLVVTAAASGEHTVEVRAAAGRGRYRLTVRRLVAAPSPAARGVARW
jgi:subtilisin family serine protease